MQAYMISAKIPRNPGQYIGKLKQYLISLCFEKKVECVVEYISGRFIVHSSEDICNLKIDFKNVISCSKVRIFENENELINYASKKIENCKSFAVRSNHLHLAQEIGGNINDITGVPANLDAPDCELTVEFRGGYYFLID